MRPELPGFGRIKHVAAYRALWLCGSITEGIATGRAFSITDELVIGPRRIAAKPVNEQSDAAGLSTVSPALGAVSSIACALPRRGRRTGHECIYLLEISR